VHWAALSFFLNVPATMVTSFVTFSSVMEFSMMAALNKVMVGMWQKMHTQ
jgi:hypothetical protein